MDRLHLGTFVLGLRKGLVLELGHAKLATTVYYRFQVHGLRPRAESHPRKE